MPFDNLLGFAPKTSQQVLTELNKAVVENLRTNLEDPNMNLNVSEETAIGALNVIMADRLSKIWDNGELIEQSFDALQAFGAGLERLALQVGFYRIPATNSEGFMWGYGTHGTVVPAKTAFANLKKDRFESLQSFEFNRESCLGMRIKIAEVVEDEKYIIYIGSIEYSYTAKATDSKETILQSLQSALDVEAEYRITSEYVESPNLETHPEDSYILITVLDVNEPIFINSSPFCTDGYIKEAFPAAAKESGYVFGAKGTIKEILGNVDGLKEVINPEDFVLGGYRETDEELRERISSDWNTVGSGTPATIDAILSRMGGVRDAVVYENTTYTDAGNDYGVPAKRYEVVVSHNTDDEAVAALIWATRPLGIEPYGNTIVQILAADDEYRDVQFTNATEDLVTLDVYFTIYDEEVYPENAETLLSDALGVAGSEFGIGDDIMPQRLISTLYRTVQGVGQASIEATVEGKGSSFTHIPMDTHEIGLIAPSRINIIATTL